MENVQKTRMMLTLVKQMGDIARMINPGINHVSMWSIGDSADFSAYIDNEYEREEVISGHMFEDGSFRIGNNYYYPDLTIDTRGEGAAC